MAPNCLRNCCRFPNLQIRKLVSCGVKKRTFTFVLAILDILLNLAHGGAIIYDWMEFTNENKDLKTKEGKLVAVMLGTLLIMTVIQIILAIGHLICWANMRSEKYLLRFWLLCTEKIQVVTMIFIPFLLQYTESALGLAANIGWLIFKFYQVIIMTMYKQGKYISNRYN